MNTITVKVTQEHIDAGLPKEACFCPIALALRDQHQWDGATVNGNTCFGGLNPVKYPYYRLSKAAIQFAADFDIGYPVKPSTFRFRLI